MQNSVVKAARPHLIRAALFAIIALAGLIGASTSGNIHAEDFTIEWWTAVAGALTVLFAGITSVRAVARAVRVALEDRLGQARGGPLAVVISVTGYILVLLSTLGALEVPLGGLLLGGALTGVVVGIAAQQTLGNFFAGIVLLVVRPFTIGEEIVLRSGPLGGEYEGRVMGMGLFYVDMLTERGPVALPNAGVLAAAVGPGARAAEPEPDAEARSDEQ